MIEIEYFGGNSVKIIHNKQELIINPKRSHVGLTDLNVKQAIEAVTDAIFTVKNDDSILVIDGPGEYEVRGYSIKGIAINGYQDMGKQCKNNNIYIVEVDDVKIAIMGNIEPNLTDEQLENIGLVDVLILPVGGGGYTLYGKEAAKIVKQIEPKVVIPTHYAGSGLNYEVPQDTLDEFIGELGTVPTKQDKLVIKKIADLPENMTIVELTRK